VTVAKTVTVVNSVKIVAKADDIFRGFGVKFQHLCLN